MRHELRMVTLHFATFISFHPMKLLTLVSVLFITLTAITRIRAADKHPWPQFRGPVGNGISSAQKVPVDLKPGENLKWKTELEGKGWSSPVISDDGSIWVTTALESVPSREEQEKLLNDLGEDPKKFKSRQIATSVTLQVLELDLASGELKRKIDLIELSAPEAIHALNSYASPTPVLENDRLYCHFGTFGTICLDTQSGVVLWQKRFPLVHNVGPGSSPFIDGDRLILIQDGVDQQYVIALNKTNGETVWKTDRPPMRAPKGDQKKAYCTPIAITDSRGRKQLVCMGSQWLVAYEPETGKEIWKLDHGKGFSVVPRPVFSEKTGLVYVSTGFGKPELWAVNPTGDGDISGTDKVAWKESKRIPAKPSPLVVGDELYVIQDGGIGTCFDAATGKVHWTERVGGNYSSSPLFADGKIYFCNQEGLVTVIEAGKNYKVLAENLIEDQQWMASPVALDGSLILRSDKAIYRFE